MAEQKGLFEKITVALELNSQNFDKQIDKSGRRVDLFGKNISIVSGRISTIFIGAVSAMGYAVKQLATDMTVTGAKFEQAITTLGAIRGLDGSGLNAFTKEARRLGATTAFTATQAAEGMQELARAGLETNEILQVTEDALKFAGANAVTMSKSTKLLAATMKQFNLDSAQSGMILDAFTTATQNSLFDVESLAVAMRYGGAVSASLSGNLQETVAVMSSFRDLGLEGSMVGTRFRQALLSLAAPTQKAKDLLKEYGLSIKDLDVETLGITQVIRNLGDAGLTTAKHLAPIVSKRAAGSIATLAGRLKNTANMFEIEAAAATLLGKSLDELTEKTDDFTQLEKALGKSIDKIDLLQIKMLKNTGVTEKTYTQMINTVSGQFKILESAIEEAQISLFTALNQEMPEVSVDGDQFSFVEGTNSLYGFKEILADVKVLFDALATGIQANSIFIGAAFSALAEKFKEAFKVEDTNAAVADLIVTFINIADEITNVLILLGKFAQVLYEISSTLISIGKIATLTLIMHGIRKGLRHLFQGMQQLVLISSQFMANLVESGFYISNIRNGFTLTLKAILNSVAGTFKLLAVIKEISRATLSAFNYNRANLGILERTKQAQAALSLETKKRIADLEKTLQQTGMFDSLLKKSTGSTAQLDTSMVALLKHLQMISAQLTVIIGQLRSAGTLSAGLNVSGAAAGASSVKGMATGTMIGGALTKGKKVPVPTGKVLQKTGKAISASTLTTVTKEATKATASVGKLGGAMRGMGTLFGAAFGGLSRFMAGPWGMLLLTVPTILELFGDGEDVIKSQSDAIDELSNSTEKYLALQERLAGLAGKTFGGSVDLKESKKASLNLKTMLFDREKLNNELLREINITRDLTDEQKQRMMNAGNLLAVKLKINGKEEELLLTQKGINDLKKTQIFDNQKIDEQVKGHIAKAERQASVYDDAYMQQLSVLQSMTAETKKMDFRGVAGEMDFVNRMSDILQLMKQLNLETDDISKSNEGLAQAIIRVRDALETGKKSRELLNNVKKKSIDLDEQERISVKETSRSRGRRQSKLLDIERKIARERLKIAAKRINETKKLENQFYIEDIRRQYDEEVKYFGKTRQQLLKIERSYVQSLLTISATIQDKYFQVLEKQKLEALRQIQSLDASEFENIDIKLNIELEKAEKDIQELKNVQLGIKSAIEQSATKNLQISLDTLGVSKKSQQALRSDLELIVLDLDTFRSELNNQIVELDRTYNASDLLNNPQLREQYESELKSLNDNFKDLVDNYFREDVFGEDALFPSVDKLVKESGKVAKPLKQFLHTQVVATNDYYNSLTKIDNAYDTKKIALKKKAKKEELELQESINKTILELEKKVLKKYDLPFTKTEIEREQGLQRLKTQKATLAEIARMQEAYNNLIDKQQEDLINELTRKYGEYTDEVTMLQKQVTLSSIPFFKQRFDNRVKYLNDIYSIEKKYEEDLSKIRDSRAEDEDYNKIAQKRGEILNNVESAQQKVLITQQNLNREQKDFINRANKLAKESGAEVELRLNYNNNDLNSFVESVSNSLQQKLESKEIGEAVFAQMQQEIEYLEQNKSVSSSKESLFKAKQGLIIKKQEEKVALEQLDRDEEALDLRNEKAIESEKDLESQKDIALKMLEQNKYVAILVSTYKVFNKITKFGIQGLETIIGLFQKMFNGIVKIFNYISGNKVTLNVFELLSEGVDNFLSKEQEAIDAQKDLAQQLARREITQAQYDEAIAKGIGAVDPDLIAKNFIDELIDESIRYANAFGKIAPLILKYFSDRLPSVFTVINNVLPKVVNALSRYLPDILFTIANGLTGLIPTIGKGIRTFISNTFNKFASNAPKMIQNLFNIVEKEAVMFLNLIIKYIPLVINVLEKIAPRLNSLISNILDLLGKNLHILLPYLFRLSRMFFKFTRVLIFELVENTLEIIGRYTKQLVQNFVQNIKDALTFKRSDEEKEEAKTKRRDLLKEVLTLGLAETESYGDTPSVIRAGTEGLMARFKAGDYVVAAQKPSDMLGQFFDSFGSGFANMQNNRMFSMQGGGSTQPIDIAIIADGRLLDAVQVSALDRGQAPKMQRKLRRASGVNVGFNRGKFNRF
jgi:TP901 family phage tail tape measure protein